MKKLITIAVAGIALIPVNGSIASADVAAGTIAFECVASLPEFPSPGASGTCGTNTLDTGPPIASSAEGVVSGTIGTTPGTPFVLVASGTDNFSAAFTYAETCIAGEAPVEGRATGTATVTGMTGVVGSTPVSGATLELGFEWRRAGAAAAIELGSATITTSSGTSAGTVAGAGQASFAPIVTQSNRCPAGGPMKAFVTGSAALTVR